MWKSFSKLAVMLYLMVHMSSGAFQAAMNGFRPIRGSLAGFCPKAAWTRRRSHEQVRDTGTMWEEEVPPTGTTGILGSKAVNHPGGETEKVRVHVMLMFNIEVKLSFLRRQTCKVPGLTPCSLTQTYQVQLTEGQLHQTGCED